MASPDGVAREALIAAFRQHLRRRQGLHAATRHNYSRYVGAFLHGVFGDGSVDLDALRAPHVIDFVSTQAKRYRVSTAKQAGTALRSFFRFLRMEGLRTDRLDEAVPGIVERRSGLPRHLDEESFRRLLSSLDRSSPCALRDRAMILCSARLGLRPGEVVGLHLDDVDWREGTLRIRRRTLRQAGPAVPARGGASLAGGGVMSEPGFVDLVRDYLDLRRRLGHRPASQGRLLLGFGGFLDRIGHRGPITVEVALRWAQTCKRPATAATRLGAVRGFLRHRSGFDPATEVPSPRLLGIRGFRPAPTLEKTHITMRLGAVHSAACCAGSQFVSRRFRCSQHARPPAGGVNPKRPRAPSRESDPRAVPSRPSTTACSKWRECWRIGHTWRRVSK